MDNVIKCPNAISAIANNTQYIKCKYTQERCVFQRYCTLKKARVLSDGATSCIYNKKS